MGRAKILNNEGEGVYTVQLLRETSKLESTINELGTKKNVVQNELDTVEYNISCIKDELDSIENELNNAIISGDDTVELSKELARKSHLLGTLRQVRNELSSRLLSIERKESLYQKELDRCNNLTELATCADFTDDLAEGTEVGLIDYGRQSSESMGPGWRPIIQPGYTSDPNLDPAVHKKDRDGDIQPAANQSPAGWLYNYIMEPGARVWRPQYRIGTVRGTECGKSTCDVQLDYNFSRNTNRSNYPAEANDAGLISDAKIEYMNCPPGVINKGDKVVVEFKGDAPKVIGFADKPRRCTEEPIWAEIEVRSFTGTGRTACSGQHTYKHNRAAVLLNIRHLKDSLAYEDGVIPDCDKNIKDSDDFDEYENHAGSDAPDVTIELAHLGTNSGWEYYEEYLQSGDKGEVPGSSGIIDRGDLFYIYTYFRKIWLKEPYNCYDAEWGQDPDPREIRMVASMSKEFLYGITWEYNGSTYTMSECNTRFPGPQGLAWERGYLIADPFCSFAQRIL